MPFSTPPEITRTDMTTPILQMKSLGIDDLMKFEWVSPPPAETVLRALEGLHAAGMVDDSGRLTHIGEQVAECPVDVAIARMVGLVLYIQLAGTKFHTSASSCSNPRNSNVERRFLLSLQ
jgi:HrpA-like RNA helicase